MRSCLATSVLRTSFKSYSVSEPGVVPDSFLMPYQMEVFEREQARLRSLFGTWLTHFGVYTQINHKKDSPAAILTSWLTKSKRLH